MTDRSMLVLLSLADGPLHGYGIKKAVAERTNGKVNLGPGTLYEAVQRLERSKWIREVPPPKDQPASGGPPRRFYELTATGRRTLASELQQMESILRYARGRRLLKGR